MSSSIEVDAIIGFRSIKLSKFDSLAYDLCSHGAALLESSEKLSGDEVKPSSDFIEECSICIGCPVSVFDASLCARIL